jgi:ABC-type transport system involved in multi-copper enzyme maturation permease subunit
MHNTLAIAKRELIAYFTSPVAYVVTAAFLVIMGLLFG